MKHSAYCSKMKKMRGNTLIPLWHRIISCFTLHFTPRHAQLVS